MHYIKIWWKILGKALEFHSWILQQKKKREFHSWNSIIEWDICNTRPNGFSFLFFLKLRHRLLHKHNWSECWSRNLFDKHELHIQGRSSLFTHFMTEAGIWTFKPHSQPFWMSKLNLLSYIVPDFFDFGITHPPSKIEG